MQPPNDVVGNQADFQASPGTKKAKYFAAAVHCVGGGIGVTCLRGLTSTGCGQQMKGGVTSQTAKHFGNGGGGRYKPGGGGYTKKAKLNNVSAKKN